MQCRGRNGLFGLQFQVTGHNFRVVKGETQGAGHITSSVNSCTVKGRGKGREEEGGEGETDRHIDRQIYRQTDKYIDI